jgi:hypothetical protein
MYRLRPKSLPNCLAWRAAAGRFLLCQVVATSALLLIAQAGADEVGIPWTGPPGVTQSVSEIMARQKDLPLQSLLQPAQSDEGRLLPNRKNMLQYSSSPGGSRFPADPSPALASAQFINPQSVGASFLGAQLSESGFIPPDTMAAVGPTQVLLCVNGRIKLFDKNGNLGLLNTTTANFFASQTGNATSDPRVRYDRLSRRWFVVMIDIPRSKKNNKILLAVSSGPVITDSTSFTFFSFAHSSPSGGGDSGAFADYPTLGIDASALYIGANIFSGASYAGTSGYVVNKTNLLNGTLTVTAFRQLASSTGPGPSTPQGVDNDDPLATEGYFIGADNISKGLLVVRRISNPDGVPSISGNLNLAVPVTVSPPAGGVVAEGVSTGLDALDDRLLAARMHKGSLWTAHSLAVNATGAADAAGGRVGSRWYEITNLTATPGLRQAGTLFDPAPSNPVNYWIPSCMVNGQGHMVLGCSVAGVNEFAEIAVAGRNASDPLGSIQAPTVVQTSSSAYNVADNSSPHRWGDYSLTSVDPNDDMTFWTVQEYCNANNSWGVRVIQIKAPPPATPSKCNPAVIPAGASNVNVVVTGLSTNGSGFFDPGPAFTNHLSASVNGAGMTVNSLSYTDPTHLVLNLTVSPAAPNGPRTLIATNPDGQSLASTSGILTISGGGANQPPVISQVPDQTINEDSSGVALPFQVGDLETSAGNLTLAASSSNTNIIPINHISFGGSGSNRTVSFFPATDEHGVAIITITVTDAGGSAALQSFQIIILSINDAPVFSKGPDQVVPEDAGPQTVLNWAVGIAAGPQNESSQALAFVVTNSNNLLFSAQPSLTVDGSLTYTPAPDANGSAIVTVRLHDDGGTAAGGVDTSPPQLFLITVTPVNDAPLLEPIPSRTFHYGAVLSFTNHALDADLNLLAYSLSNAPAGATIHPTTGVFTWTPGLDQINSTNFITVIVTDDGSPSLSDAKTFTATVLPPPLISSVAVTHGIVTIAWQAIIGNIYHVQSKTDLDDASPWEDLGESVTATEPTASKEDAGVIAARRFYRIRADP